MLATAFLALTSALIPATSALDLSGLSARLGVALHAGVAAQEPPPLGPGVVARLGDREISKTEYLEYLYTRFGKRAVNELVSDMLIEEEARRYGISVSEEVVAQKVQEREDTARESPRPGNFEDDLKRSGQSIEMFRTSVRAEIRRDMLLNELVLATRVVTDEKLNAAFESEYGTDGVKLQVRHIVCMPNFLKAEKIRGGARPNEVDMESIRTEARAMVVDARARLLAGEDFAVVCAQVSHDRVTKDKGGEIAHYNGRLYGPLFRSAILSLEPGGISEVVETGAGFHVVQLLERSETTLDSVREQLVQQILEAEPNWQEKSSLIQSLQGRAKLQLW